MKAAVIYGAGTMGLMMLELAERAGAATISIIDINPTRLDTARLLVFISHHYPLDDYTKAITQFRAGVGRKIQIICEGT